MNISPARRVGGVCRNCRVLPGGICAWVSLRRLSAIVQLGGGCQVFKSDCLGQTGTSHFGVWWKQPAALAWNFPVLLHNLCLLALEPNRAALNAERCSAERPAQDKPLAAESSASAELSLDTSPPPRRPGLSAAQRAFQLTVSSSGHWCQFYWGPRREKWSVWKWKEEHLVNWSQQVCSRLGTSPPLPASFINS